MEILYLLTFAFVIFWLFGLALVTLLRCASPYSLYRIQGIRLTVPVIGYVSINLIWWVDTFLLRWPSVSALLAAVAFLVLAIIVAVRSGIRRRLLMTLLPARSDWPLMIVIACVVALSTWSYLVAGVGNFFLVNETDFFNRTTPAILNSPVSLGVFSKEYTLLRTLFPLQLSTLTLFQRLTGCTSADAACLQAILNLTYTAIGVFWLSRYILRFAPITSVFGAIFSVAGQFYFHTYLDGHLGSLMYVCAAPFLFGLCIAALARDRYLTTLPIIGLLWLFMSKSYPLVAYLLLPPLMLAKLRLLYLHWRESLMRKLSRLFSAENHWYWRHIRWLLIGGAVISLMPGYYIVRALFYPNRISLAFNGYQPMYIVFDPEVLEWFFGLRLTQGFGYGFVQPASSSNMASYDYFATALAIGLVLIIGVAAWHCRRRAVQSFLSLFLLTFPVMAVAFALVWPFSYLVYKALYVHYFLIVLSVCGGVHFVSIALRRRIFVWRHVVFGVIFVAAGINLFGSVKNTSIGLERVLLLDLDDCRQLVKKIQRSGIRAVTLVPTHDLIWILINYSLRESGIDTNDETQVGLPLVTAQHVTMSPIADKDIILRSPKGKYIMSHTPDSLVQVFSPASTSTEVQNGVGFRWLSTDYDYNRLQMEKYFAEFARYWRSLPGKPIVYNDLADSGYYLFVEELLARNNINYSDNPGKSEYFLRLSREIPAVIKRMQGSSSPVVVAVTAASGKPRVGKDTYVNQGNVVWSNDLFEAARISEGARILAPISGLDAEGLINIIQSRKLVIANAISQKEHERWYLEDRLMAANIYPVSRIEHATAVLMCIPNFMLEEMASNDPAFATAVLWRAPESFAKAQGYQVVLLRQKEASHVERSYLKGAWSGQLPLRTVLWTYKRPTGEGLHGEELIEGNPELKIRVYRFDRDLRLLFETGPSLADSSLVLRAVREDGRKAPQFFTLSSPSQLITLHVDQFAVPGEAQTDIAFETGLDRIKRVMPFDDRLLVFRIDDCELVDRGEPIYTDAIKRVLKADWQTGPALDAQDVVDTRLFPEVALGTGWYQRETENGRRFRWMADGAELVIEGGRMEPAPIQIIGQVGPSAPTGRISISVALNGRPVSNFDVVNGPRQRATLLIDCGTSEFKQAWRRGQNIFTLSIKGAGKRIPGDPRILGFRAFQIRFGENFSSKTVIR